MDCQRTKGLKTPIYNLEWSRSVKSYQSTDASPYHCILPFLVEVSRTDIYFNEVKLESVSYKEKLIEATLMIPTLDE